MAPLHLVLWVAIAISTSKALFILKHPPSLGLNEFTENQAPCGSFDPASRKLVSNWPIAGAPIHVLMTSPSATWTYKAALVSDVNNWVDLQPDVSQTGIGDWCLTAVPGLNDWIGKDVVVQVTQKAAADSTKYQVGSTAAWPIVWAT